MTIDNELIDNLLKDYKKPEDIIGENGLLKQLTKQLLERAMAAEPQVNRSRPVQPLHIRSLFTNNDSAGCTASSFDLQSVVPAGWSSV